MPNPREQRKSRVAIVDTEEDTSALLARLTKREREVMSLLSRGLLYKEVADELRISYSAVHKHQHKIFKKLQVSNRSEASRKWFKTQG